MSAYRMPEYLGAVVALNSEYLYKFYLYRSAAGSRDQGWKGRAEGRGIDRGT
jgi:hypothetical protein